MTDTMKTELRREAFEKWAQSMCFSLNRAPFPADAYMSPATDYAYIGWCAALDSQAAQAQPLSDEKLLGLFRQSFPKTKFSSAYRQFARDVEAAASPSHSKEPGDGEGVLGRLSPPNLEVSSPNSSAASNGPLRNSETGEAGQHQGNEGEK